MKLLSQIEMTDYYLSKIEHYLGRKHQNIIHRHTRSGIGGSSSGRDGGTDSLYSGSPKSTISDRTNTLEDDERKDDFGTANFESMTR